LRALAAGGQHEPAASSGLPARIRPRHGASRFAAALTALTFAVATGAAAQSGTAATPGAPVPFVFSPWVKLCTKALLPGTGICVIARDDRLGNGELLVSVEVVEMDGEPRKLFRLRMPYGVALQFGSRMIVDQGQPATAPFVTCLPPVVAPGGCVADYQADADLIARLKSGRVLTVQAIHMNGQPLSPQFDLSDFARVYDGPPTDPKVMAEQQKKPQKPKDDTRQPQQRPKN
jgi:invasion protein IalB